MYSALFLPNSWPYFLNRKLKIEKRTSKARNSTGAKQCSLAFNYYTGQGYINQSNQFDDEGLHACEREKHVHCENMINLGIKKIQQLQLSSENRNHVLLTNGFPFCAEFSICC